MIPDGEVPNGEHPIDIDLKVLGVKPVSLARLDLHINHGHLFISIASMVKIRFT